MILADKIIRLRKKNGWSQEELANKMNVSRQAVSKWEAAQTTPDLEKILQLGNLFGVTTDYLLKDELVDEEFVEGIDEIPIRKISLAEANDYLEQRKNASVQIAIATLLCIISPILLFLLLTFSEYTSIPITENLAVGIGIVALFSLVTIAVIIYIRVGFKNTPYEFLENEPFETEYGVTGLAREKQKTYRNTYIKYNIFGTCICILSPLLLICAALSGKGLLVMIMLCVTLLTVAIGVMFFIVTGVRWASMQKLLKEGGFSEKGKRKNRIIEVIGTIYWLSATTIYLGWSFLTNNWHITWVIWPISGILFIVVELVCTLILDKQVEK